LTLDLKELSAGEWNSAVKITSHIS